MKTLANYRQPGVVFAGCLLEDDGELETTRRWATSEGSREIERTRRG